MKGNKYCVGRKLSQSHIDALRKSNIGSHRPCKYKGVAIHTERTKCLLSEMAKERWQDPEMRQKYLLSKPDMRKENNPMYGKKHTDKTKQLISERAKERCKSNPTYIDALRKSHLDIGKRVNQYDLQGNLLATFPTCRKAGLSVNGNGSNICFACKNSNKTYKGYKWGYAE